MTPRGSTQAMVMKHAGPVSRRAMSVSKIPSTCAAMGLNYGRQPK
jgi:hypothetical protein